METRSNQATLPFGTEVASELASLLARQGLELCHVDWRQGRSRGVLTLTIDRDGGVSLEDCEEASRIVDAFLETVEELASPYVLEVASPGLDRPLWTPRDWAKFTGSRVRVRLFKPVDGAANLKGIIESADGEGATILDEDQRRRYTVRFGEVKNARLVPDYEPGGAERASGRPEGKETKGAEGASGSGGSGGSRGRKS
jgi:ribosome maturation factor RimP